MIEIELRGKMKKKTKKELHTWYVRTGMYNKQLPCRTTGMIEAQKMAFEKFKKMSFEEFKEYVSFGVGGMRYPSKG